MNVDDERYPPRQLQWFIDGAKEEGLRAERRRGATTTSRAALVELYAAYEEQCQREGVVDFAELLLRCYELLRDNEPLREHYQRALPPHPGRRVPGHQHAAVPLAEACSPGRDTARVRGRRRRPVDLRLPRRQRRQHGRTSSASSASSNVIKLEQNYRSHGHILDAANALIAHNATRLGKNLWTERGQGRAGARVRGADRHRRGAAFIVEEVQGAARATASPLDEIALLYRSNAQSRVLEHALFNAGMPYRVYGGLRFFERAEIKHALAYLRLLDEPGRRHRVPARGQLPAARHRRAHARAAAGRRARAAARACGRRRARRRRAARPATASRRSCADRELRARRAALPLPEIIEHVLERMRACSRTTGSEKDGADRIENLEELVNAAESFVREDGFARRRADRWTADAAVERRTASDRRRRGRSDGATDPLTAFLTHAALEAGDTQAQGRPTRCS